MFEKLIGALAGLAMMSVVGSANASLILDGSGNLLGATDVLLDGTLYGVKFVEGRCIDLFNGCDDAATDFDFTDEATALLAAEALLDQVFINSVLGLFDSEPDLTYGCEDIFRCFLWIPFDVTANGDVTVAVAFNADAGASLRIDEVFKQVTDRGGSTTAAFSIAWVQFTPVPEPATLTLFATGLAGLGFMMRRRRSAVVESYSTSPLATDQGVGPLH